MSRQTDCGQRGIFWVGQPVLGVRFRLRLLRWTGVAGLKSPHCSSRKRLAWAEGICTVCACAQGKELEFYLKKMQKKKGKQAA